MKILVVHQNFPGQYRHLARHLGARPEHEVLFITQRSEGALAGVKKILYRPRRAVAPDVHRYLRETEAAVLNAQEVARVAFDLRAAGFTPDVMLGHNGWGEIWYLKDVFPQAPLIGYFEFFYRLTGADVGFDPDDSVTADIGPRIRTKNLGNLLGLEAADLGQTATEWQKSLYPVRYHARLHVRHEGIDTVQVRPDETARLALGAHTVAAGEEVVTYVARNLEPYRGFPSFMRSLPAILAARPRAHVLIVGGDEVSYGRAPPGGGSYRERLLAELDGRLDLARVHFLGKVPYATYLKVLQVSRVHVYLTYPFVLSHSMLEAMAAGCLVVGSRTAPVEEFIESGRNGVLVDFFSPAEIAARVIEALEDRHAHDPLRRAARATVESRCDLERRCLPAMLELIERASGRAARRATPQRAAAPPSNG